MSFTFGWNTTPTPSPPPLPFQNFVSICIVKDQKWSCKKTRKMVIMVKKMKFLKVI